VSLLVVCSGLGLILPIDRSTRNGGTPEAGGRHEATCL